MSYDWAEFLHLAQHLWSYPAEGVTEAARCRTAVSRAYYAAYGHAVQYASADLGFTPSKRADDHHRVRLYLSDVAKQLEREDEQRNASVTRNLSLIANLLDVLRRRRNRCDYAGAIKDDQLRNRVIQSLEDSRMIFAAVGELKRDMKKVDVNRIVALVLAHDARRRTK